MTGTVVNDWKVVVGYDDTPVQKGVAKLEKTMARLDRATSKATTKQTSQFDKQNKAISKQNSLEAQRLQLRKRIAAAEKMGIQDLKRDRGALGGTNPVKIRSQVLDLDKRITAERQKQAKAAAKAMKAESSSKAIENQRKQIEERHKAAVRQLKLEERIRKVKSFEPIEKRKMGRSPELPEDMRRRTSPRGQRRASQPRSKTSGFDLDAARQLKMVNTIDSVVRRARRGLDETSEDFQQITQRAERLKRTISGIGSKTDLERFNNQVRLLRENTTQATMAQRKLNAQIQRQKFIARATTDSIRNLARSYVSVFAAFEGASFAIRVGKEFEDLSATMLLSSGSSEQAAKDFEFVRNMSMKMGLDLRGTTRAFTKFAVAANTGGLSAEKAKAVFTDLSTSIRATGLSQDRANLAFLGFQQMLAGPVVQAQEMNQIIEQMPQFTGMAKRALAEMGMEVDNYREAVATGTVESKEFVTIVTRMMSEQAKQTGAYEKSLKSMTAAQGRFTTSLELSLNEFFGAGGKEGIVKVFGALTDIVVTLQPMIKILGGTFRLLGTVIGGVVGALGSATRSMFSLVSMAGDVVGGITDIISTSEQADDTVGDIGKTGLLAWRGWNVEIEEVQLNLELLMNDFKIFFATLERLFRIANENLKFTLNPFEAMENTKKALRMFNQSVDRSYSQAGIVQGSSFQNKGVSFSNDIATMKANAANGGGSTNQYNVSFNVKEGNREEIQRNWESFMQDTLVGSMP